MRYSWYCHVVWSGTFKLRVARVYCVVPGWLGHRAAGQSGGGGTIWRQPERLGRAAGRACGYGPWVAAYGIWRGLLRAAIAAMAVALTGCQTATPARVSPPATSAAPTSATLSSATPRVYDALGDSYASGAGVEPYDEDTCMRSAQAPGRLVDAQSSIVLDDLVACAGATTGDIADQVRALDAETDLVTVSIGGNDVRWAQSVGTCIIADESSCASAVQDSEATAREVLPGRLDTAYGQIREAAPKARVLVTGYARLFTEDRGDYQSGLGVVTGREQTMMNEGADALNEAIAAAATRHGFDFVDVTGRFVEHGVNAPQPWILGFGTSAPFHPTAAGYQAYAEAIVAAVD